MIIKKIILYRYKRFFLNNIEKLVYTPYNQNQVILGSNGSGKSSLFKELTPLPADIKKNYNDGGYKEIHIEHFNSFYILKSGVDGATKHNFIKDGVELNNGGTRKVQLELIESTFNINPKIMNILLSIDNFTIMNLNERKEILSLCSDIDYSCALSIFLKLKSKHRDIIGGIKLTNDEIVKNEALVKNKGAIEKLKNDQSKLLEYINFLKTSLYRDIKNIDFSLYKEKVKNVSCKLEKVLSTLANDNFNIFVLEKSITKKQTELELTIKRIEATTQAIKELEVVGNLENKDTLEVKRKSLLEKLKQLEPLLTIKDIELDKYAIVQNEFSNIKTDLIDIFSDIDQYNNVRFLEKKDKELIENNFLILTDKLKSIDRVILVLKRDIEHTESHMKETGKVICPKCEHSWYPNINIGNLKKLKSDLVKHTEQQDKLKDEYSIVEQQRNLLLEYKEYIKNIKSIVSYNLQLKPVWGYFFNTIDLNKSTSDYIITTLNKIGVILNNYKNYFNIHNELKVVENDLNILEKMNTLTKDISKDRLKSLEKDLEELTAMKHSIEKEIDFFSSRVSAYNSISTYYKELRSILESGYINNTIKSYYNDDTIGIIIELEKIESDIAYKISQIEISYSKLESDKVKLENYKKKETIYKDLVKALSPTEGLIAKSMNSFINKFISDMNSVINTIWSYPMEIKTSDIEEDTLDLNYKFKVVVNDDEGIEDISKLSSSMQEIVNLAFKIVLCRYLNLREVPLYLDEFGSTFDSKHRNKAYQVVDKILSSDFKQIFMICHYESLYGSLQNTDFNVLNQDNIELNDSIEKNKNFMITYG